MSAAGPHHHVRSGEILHIAEILARGSHANAQSVRVLGTLLSFDHSLGIATIEHCGARLTVDTSALDVAFHPGELLQFIGEVSVPDGGEASVRARIVRNVSGLKLDLLDLCLKAKRDFEREDIHNSRPAETESGAKRGRSD